MKPLEFYLTQEQEGLFNTLRSIHKNDIVSVCKKHYILVRGQAPFVFGARLDTVHCEPVRDICKTKDEYILMSPQGIGGDDRCGVYALNAVYEQSKVKPWLLFTCDEEVGGIGAEQFCLKYRNKKLPKELNKLKLIVEIDRKGSNDAVYYDCDNKDFEEFISQYGFKTDIGSFSDISYIAPTMGIAAVNLSSGYYNAHTQHEYIVRNELESVVSAVTKIVNDSTDDAVSQYQYIEAVKTFKYPVAYKWSSDTKYDTYYSSSYYSPYWNERDWDGYDYDEDKIPDDIPDTIIDEYEALLDYYSVEELEEIRKENGDYAITMLCQSEFGDSYWSMFKNDSEDEK